MGSSKLGQNLTLSNFRGLSEKEQYAYAFTAYKAITHLRAASIVAKTKMERARSVFGAHNLKKSLKEARRRYDQS